MTNRAVVRWWAGPVMIVPAMFLASAYAAGPDTGKGRPAAELPMRVQTEGVTYGEYLTVPGRSDLPPRRRRAGRGGARPGAHRSDARRDRRHREGIAGQRHTSARRPRQGGES